MATIQLEVVSPDHVVYTADIAMLIVRSTGGELGILPHHAPLVTGLVPHAMRAKLEGGNEELIAVAGGFMEVQPQKITVLASAAETPIEIDINRAQRAYARAKERLESELKIARNIQMSFLPKKFPPFPDITSFALHADLLPAREVGGDLYDFFLLSPGRLRESARPPAVRLPCCRSRSWRRVSR